MLKKLVFFVLFSTLFNLSAQKYRPMNQPYIDLRPYNLGFSLGMHTQDLHFTHTGIYDNSKKIIYAEQPSFTPGFNAGLLANFRMSHYFSFRFSPTLFFGSKTVQFIDYESSTYLEKQNIRSTYLLFPFNVKYHAFRFNNARPYLVGGISFGFDLTRKKDQPLLLKPMNSYLEFGVGCDFYFPYFKLIPEIKFCLGLSDVLDKERKDLTNLDYAPYTKALNKVTSRLLVFSLYFE
ncbi:MAG: porin family protein [Bacteroidales bacterium]